ncbi:quinon protein alcohol dehydrogenase-like superfamily [Suillus discolor]|uniref:Quinon protein alcohol dehydrogenase-like superfamily n=1 Tax=Suillus discolor TaxID=1912936 RepID=A0A9P7F4C4_9AGAM|nr:quinon protein alcohol dehydrogenase-like superfamily [Suillus discolor]KAG2106990.1 quinon protein alcohol dehydrogenase-like superfamily [Suillus discolor]
MASSSKQPGIAAKKSILTPVMTLEGHKPFSFSLDYKPKYVSHISYFPDGKQMISGSSDNIIQRWDLREGKEIKEAREVYKILYMGWECQGMVDGLSLQLVMSSKCVRSRRGSTLLAGATEFGIGIGIRIWRLDTGKLMAGPFVLEGEYVDTLGLSEDSQKLAVTSWRWNSDSKQSYLEVWDVQAQKLVVTREKNTPDFTRLCLPVLWTTKDKFITTFFSLDDDMSIYEYDASTLKTVGDSFQGHTDVIRNLALSFDCLLLVSASYDNAIKLWSFGSRQLLASFDVQRPYSLISLILSPDSRQLAYTNRDKARIYICDIPTDILASISLAKETSAHLAKLLDSDAIRHPVRRKPAISVIPSVPRPPAVIIEPPQPAFLGFLRKLFSSHTDTTRPTRTNINEPRNPLDFPATAPLPRPIVNPHDDFQPPTTQSSAPTPTTFKSRLSTWWSLQINHASTAIADVPLAQGKERNAAAGAPRRKNDEWIPDEDHVSSPPSPNPDLQQPTTAGQLDPARCSRKHIDPDIGLGHDLEGSRANHWGALQRTSGTHVVGGLALSSDRILLASSSIYNVIIITLWAFESF